MASHEDKKEEEIVVLLSIHTVYLIMCMLLGGYYIWGGGRNGEVKWRRSFVCVFHLSIYSLFLREEKK